MSDSNPRPWRLDSDTIRDANGCVVVSALNPCGRETRRLIVDAVNERDRLAADEARYRAHNVVLRDIVRRLLPSLQQDIAQCNGPKQAPRLAALLDEASAALGEGGRA